MGQKPDYKFLRVFGCACFPYLQPYNKHKLAFKTSKCLFLGYGSFHKGYRCLHPSGRVYIARSVAFDETTFPYQSLFALTPTVPHLKSYGAPGFVIPSLPSSTTSASSTTETSNLSHVPSPCFKQKNTPLSSSSQADDVPLISVPFLSPISPNVSSSSSSSHCHSAQELIQSYKNNPPFAISGQSIYHMQTKSKSGVFKPKLYTARIHSEPVSVSLAVTDPCWKKAMEEEYNALV